MRPFVKLVRIFGVEIRLHWSCLLLAFLITLPLARHFRAGQPGWSADVVWASALLISTLFFAGLVAHELSHALIAQAFGLPVRTITLFALGGLARIEREPTHPHAELAIGMAGPIASGTIGCFCLVLARSLDWQPLSKPATASVAVLVWLGVMNLSLATFNMLPAFPLDGGRVFRAVLWWWSGSPERSLLVAAYVSHCLSVLLMSVGAFAFLVGAGFPALSTVLAGWFLLEAARATYVQTRSMQILRGVSVCDLMDRECPSVDSRRNLASLFEQEQLSAERCLFVVTGAQMAGLITSDDLKGLARRQWTFKTACDVMRPLHELVLLAPDTPASEALEAMGRANASCVLVGRADQVEGVVLRSRILHFVQERLMVEVTAGMARDL
jgi:Zn-dependent protease